MGKHKRLTYIEILLILAIIAVLAVWLFPRFLKILDSNSPTVGIVKPYIGDTSPAPQEVLVQLLSYSGFPEPFLEESRAFHNKWTRDYSETAIREDIGAHAPKG